MPGCRLTSMKGPVPLALKEAWLSSLFLKSSGLVTLFFSHQARLMMNCGARCCRKIGLALSRRNSTVSASTASGVPSALA